MRHNPSLACMVGIMYAHIDTLFAFYENNLIFYTHLYLVGCLSRIIWTRAVLGVLHAFFFSFALVRRS